MTTRLDPKFARDVRVLVLTGYGLNCEAETAAGFTFAGATADTVHLGDLLERPTPRKRLSEYHLVAFVGGFSFGDHVASGRVYGNRLRFRSIAHAARADGATHDAAADYDDEYDRGDDAEDSQLPRQRGCVRAVHIR